MPKRAQPEPLPSVVVSSRHLRYLDAEHASWERPRVDPKVAIAVSPTGFDAGGENDWSIQRVTSGRLNQRDVLDRALLVQSVTHYEPILQAGLELRRPLERDHVCAPGAWAENLTVSGSGNSKTLCVGDVLVVRGSGSGGGSKRGKRAAGRDGAPGSNPLRLQVSGPCRPCSKVDIAFGKTWDGKGVRAFTCPRGLRGWFFRVLEPGTLSEGDELVVVERPYPQWSLERLSDTLYGMKGACDKPSGYTLPGEGVKRSETDKNALGGGRSLVESLWRGTEAELRELAGMDELALFEWRDELVAMLAAWDKGDGWNCIVS